MSSLKRGGNETVSIVREVSLCPCLISKCMVQYIGHHDLKRHLSLTSRGSGKCSDSTFGDLYFFLSGRKHRLKKILAVKVKCICYTTQSLLWFLIYDRSTIREWQLLEWNLGGLMLVKRFVPFYFCSFPVSKFFMFKQNDQKNYISIQAFKIMFWY